MADVIIARVIHVLAVVIWIGGVAMATSVALPAIRSGSLGENRLAAFKVFEHRFIWQARSALVLVGLTGAYMTWRLDLWTRFYSWSFWWMHAMVGIWLLFAFILFVAEPLIFHRRFAQMAAQKPDRALARLHRVHWLLLIGSLVTLAGGVAGSHGW